MSQRQILNYLFLLANSAKVIHEFISSLLWKTLFFYLDVVTEERSMWTIDRRVQGREVQALQGRTHVLKGLMNRTSASTIPEPPSA